MLPELVPRIRIYLRQLKSQAEDFEDILSCDELTISDLEDHLNQCNKKVQRLINEHTKAETRTKFPSIQNT